MLTQYHASITSRALSECFSPHALEVIIAANLGQDNLGGQFGHDEYHFDNNAFEESHAFIEAQRALTVSSLQDEDIPAAWAAFGRLTHTAQDFYAHTNYVDLWLARCEDPAQPSPSEIAPLIEELVNSPELQSGKLYYPFEALSFVPFLKRFVIPFLPKDSHAWMNIDSPDRGKRFEYAFEAALKRTRYEFDRTVAGLSSRQVALFSGSSS